MSHSTLTSVRRAVTSHPLKAALGGIALVALVVAVSAMVPELIRYVRIRRM